MPAFDSIHHRIAGAIGRALVGLALLLVYLTAMSDVSRAQTMCADISTHGDRVNANSSANTCTFNNDTVPANSVSVIVQIFITGPQGSCPNAGAVPCARVIGASGSPLAGANTFIPQTVTINAGGACTTPTTQDNVPGGGLGSKGIGIADGDSCTLTAFATANGQTIGITGTLARTGANITFTSAVTIAQNSPNTVASLQSAFNSATPGVLDTINGTNGTGNGNGVTFAPTGLGFAQSGIDSVKATDWSYGSGLGPNGYFHSGQKRTRGNGFNFSVDLNRLANSAANDDRSDSADYATGSSKDGLAPSPQSRITSFIKGEYVDFDDGESQSDRDGHLWVVTSGLGLRVSPSTTIGLLSRYRSGEAESNVLDADLDSDFWGGGAFLTTTLGGGLNVAIAGLYETGDNDIRIGTATGSFDSEHLTIEGRIDKRLQRGTFWIEPGVGFRYIDTEQDNYTDSLGTLVTNQDLTLGRLTYGPRIGTTLHRSNATVRPFAKFGGVWDFENDGSFATSTTGTFTSADHGFNAGGGIEVSYVGGLSIRIQGDWTNYDTELEVWSVSGGIGSPLSALGLGQVGFVSLDFSANAEDASAQARLRIPLGKTN